MNPLEFAAAVFAVYAVTGLVTVSHLFKPFRRAFREVAWELLPFRLAKHFVKHEPRNEQTDNRQSILEDDADLDLSTERQIEGYDFIACRMCVGLWVTAALYAWNAPPAFLLGIYGAAYFLATQERE